MSFALPSVGVKSSKPSNAVEKEEIAPLPQELTASTALALWYEMMQRAIIDGGSLTEVDNLGFNFLHYAALEGNVEVIEMLIEKGCNVNYVAQNHQQIIPMHWAALRGHAEAVILLLEKGGDMNLGDSEGHTALLKAAQYGQTHVCQVLVARGCAPDQTDIHKHTGLHWACYMGRLLTAQYLIRAGCGIGDKDIELRTPLHRAVQMCTPAHFDIVCLLLRLGAHVEVNEGSDENDMLKMCVLSKGKASKHIMAVLEGSQETSVWPRLLLGIKDRKGNFAYHNRQLEFTGKFPTMVCIFTCNVINCFFVYFRYMFPFVAVWTHVHVVGFGTSILALISYLVASKMDPGYISMDQTEEERRNLNELVKTSEGVKEVCSTCCVRKRIRSKHCKWCDKCVAKFDHHCPWIGNCVGYRNHAVFVIFLGTCSLTGVLYTIMCFKRVTLDEGCPPVDGPIALFLFGFFFLRYYTWMCLSCAVGTFFTGYFGIMFLLHIRQVLYNISANEMENAWRYKYLKRSADPSGAEELTEFHNPFDRGMGINCAESFCRPLMQQCTGQGRILGSDGYARACPSQTFPDYYKICDMSELSMRTPTYREMLTLKDDSSHRKYELLTTDDPEDKV